MPRFIALGAIALAVAFTMLLAWLGVPARVAITVGSLLTGLVALRVAKLLGPHDTLFPAISYTFLGIAQLMLFAVVGDAFPGTSRYLTVPGTLLAELALVLAAHTGYRLGTRWYRSGERRQLAQRHGWQHQATDPAVSDLLPGLATLVGESTGPARNVLRGAVRQVPFTVLDAGATGRLARLGLLPRERTLYLLDLGIPLPYLSSAYLRNPHTPQRYTENPAYAQALLAALQPIDAASAPVTWWIDGRTLVAVGPGQATADELTAALDWLSGLATRPDLERLRPYTVQAAPPGTRHRQWLAGLV